MELYSESFDDGDEIPGQFAFCVPDPDTHATYGDNLNPHFAWSDLPEETESLVLICHDPDVPSKGDDVNQEGREVPSDLDRIDFYHWVLVDIDPELEGIDEGEYSEEVTPHGKDVADGPHGTRQGINDYTNWFDGNPDMEGDFYGYDGPCPPWNDSIVHHYTFTLYALDVAKCPIEGVFTGADVLDVIEPHVLDQARIVGLYSLNPDVDA
jgi:Raf kinase inhibitor-like YbhB/YbcL family protein